MYLQILWNNLLHRQMIALLAGLVLLSACAGNDEPSSHVVYYELEDYYKEENFITAPFKEPKEYNPARFMGKTYDDVFNQLGRPDFARREGNKEFLQYRGKDCIMDIFVDYEQPVSGQNSRDANILDKKQALARKSARVVYAELRDRQVDAAVPPTILRQCLYLLVESRPAQHKKQIKQAKKQAKKADKQQ